MLDIEINCECGQKYIFEVEPIDNHMPTSIFCPSCGKDGTAIANQQIAGLPSSAASQPQHLPYKEPPSPAPHSTVPSPIPTVPSVSGTAKASLICGIVAVVGCFLFFPLFAAFPAIILGHLALSSIKKSNGTISGRGKAKLGTILGYIGCALFFIFIILGVAASYNASRSASESDYGSSGDYGSGHNGGELSRNQTFSGVFYEVKSKSYGSDMSFTSRITWDFRSNGTVYSTDASEMNGQMSNGITSTSSGIYKIYGNAIQIRLENDKSYSFDIEGNGDIISSETGSRLVRLR